MNSEIEVEIVVVAFLVDYVVAVVVAYDLVEVDVAAKADDLVAGVTASVVVVVALADVVFDDDYIVACVAFDVVVVASLFAFVAADDDGFPAVSC